MAINERARGLVWVGSLIAIVGAGGWVGREWWVTRQYRFAMESIREELEGDHQALAARDLRALLPWSPDPDRVLYLLGYCERSRGNHEAATEAWARVAPTSRFAIAAIVGRMEMEVERGRLADAERLIRRVVSDPRIDPFELAMEFAPVYVKEGRDEEARELIEGAWTALDRAGRGATEPAILLLRLHIEIGAKPDPVEATRSLLDRSGRLAPDDERVWLGKANLALRLGELDEAGRWLDACLHRAPDDRSVWRARLDWAIASNRTEEAIETIRHLPEDREPPARVAGRAAWLAGRRGDREAEHRALSVVLIENPADRSARARLIAMAIQDGQPDLAEKLRSEGARIHQLEERYWERYRRAQPSRDAEAMARLAAQLGRRFEARGLFTLAIAMDPGRRDLRTDLAAIDGRPPE